MKKFLIYCFYKVELGPPIKWNEKQYKWNFKMVPRKINISIVFILLSPLIILFFGVLSIPKIIKESFRTLEWSSYEVILPKEQKPNMWELYKKF